MNDRRRFYGERTSRNRLLRDTENNMFFGVCAGAADYFGFDVQITRIFVALGGFFFFPTVLVIYLILGFLLEEAPRSPEAPRSQKERDTDTKPARSRAADRKQAPPEEPMMRRKRREDRELRRRVRSEPQATLRSVRHRSRELDRRLQRLEKYVTSKKFNLQREIDGLGE